MRSDLQLISFNRAAIEQVRRSLIAHPISLAMRLECFTFERFHYVGLTQYENSGRKNVLHKLLRIPHRRLFVRLCLSLREFWLRLNEMHKMWAFASRKALSLLCGFYFSSLENYFGLGTTNVKGKTDHPVSLRWNKEFWTFPKRRVFFWLFIRFICE